MPFSSKAQQRYMYSQHPEIAKRWEDKYGIPKDLPPYTRKPKVARKRRRIKHT